MSSSKTETETTKPQQLTNELLDMWATDPNGPVALHLKQRLLAVEGAEGEEQIIYPPTYADIGYNIDRLSDGTRVALIDSVGSQANRLEPAFKSNSGHDLAGLVPQIDIVLRKEDCGKCNNCVKEKRKNSDACLSPWKEKRSLFDLAHRAADAVVQSSPTLRSQVEAAFAELRRTGDATKLCTIAPTSLVFGCWDSRGGSGEKRPRLVRAIIRAWDVDELHTGAQFNSVWKSLGDDEQESLTESAKKINKNKPNEPLSKAGLKDAPAVKYKDGRRVLGGIVVRGQIERSVTVNLVALRGLNGGQHTDGLRKYLLGLSILAATSDIELFLREGCNLRYADKADKWYSVPRRGDSALTDLTSENAKKVVIAYAKTAHKAFQEAWKEIEWPKGAIQENRSLEVDFDLAAAKELLGQATEEESEEKS